MRQTKFACAPIGVSAWLLIAAQGCVVDGAPSSGAPREEEDFDATEEDVDASVELLEEKAGETSLTTDQIMARVAALPDKTLVVFDFDDTLWDHVEGSSGRWAAYAKSAVTYLKQRGIPISVCSRNQNSNGALNRALRGLDSSVFNDTFFKSPAFQTDTGLDKSDDIRQAMAFYGIKRDAQVVFFDDDQGNLNRVNAATDVLSIMVNANGIDREEFRSGMIQRLNSTSGGSTGGSCSGKCSSSCPCQEGQGDCDSNADCASGLYCPADAAGAEFCTRR